MSWDRPFPQPVPLPEGPPAQTLRDAANYIRMLPQPERDCQEWRLAVQLVIDAAEDRGPILFAHMGIARALEVHSGTGPCASVPDRDNLKRERDIATRA